MIGEVLGSYRVVSCIGQGGMGAVYLAEHELLGRRAAVKVILPALSEDPEAIQRFFNEARAATRLRHPAFVDVFDFGRHPSGHAYLIMDYIEGETLAHRLRRKGRLPVPTAAEIGRQVAAAMAVAHAASIVHRDLKPENLILVPDPETPGRERVKILDFGVAKLGGSASVAQTGIGAVLGTPLYMSPEQCKSAASADGRSDIYSLGGILLTMLCGRPPFEGTSAFELIAAHLGQDAPAPRSLEPAVPSELSDFVLTLLAKEPDHRPGRMEDVERTLARFAGAAPRARSDRSTDLLAPGTDGAAPAHDDGVSVGRTAKLPSTASSLQAGGGTTLGRSASERAAPRARSGSRRTAIVATVAGVIAVGAAGALLLRGNVHEPEGDRIAPSAHATSMGGTAPGAPPAAASAPSPTPPAPAAPPVPAAAPTAASAPTPAPPDPTAAAPASGHDARTAALSPPRARTPAPARPPRTVQIVVSNPQRGLAVTVDGRPGKLPLNLPRDGKSHELRFQTPGLEDEIFTVRAEGNQRLQLKNARAIFID